MERWHAGAGILLSGILFSSFLCMAQEPGPTTHQPDVSVVLKARCAPMRLKGDDNAILVAGDATLADQGSNYWLWRIDHDGQLSWKFSFPANHQEEVKDMVFLKDGGVAILGSLFATKPVAGFKTWMQMISRNGESSEPVVMDRMGMASALLLQEDGTFLAGGAARAESSSQGRGYDAWMVRLSADGKQEWEHFFNTGLNERILEGLVLRDRSILWVVTAENVDATGLSRSSILLLCCDVQGKVLRQHLLEGPARFSGQGTHVAESPDGLILIYSDTPVQESVAGPGATADHSSILLGLDLELNVQWQTRLSGYVSMLTPVLGVTEDRELLVAGTKAAGPELSAIKWGGEIAWTMPLSPNHDEANPIAMNVVDMAVQGRRVTLTGMATDLMKPSITEQVYLLAFSLKTRQVEWVKNY
ncbi:MAG: hypothetical protein V2A34_03665 [Lentisphaerota bacterium]